MCVEGVFTGEQGQQLNMVVCEHLFRQGKLDVGEKVVQVQLLVPTCTTISLCVARPVFLITIGCTYTYV